MKNAVTYKMLLLSIFVVVLFTLDVVFGSVKIPIDALIEILTHSGSPKESWKIIVLDSRLPKALTAIAAGIGLSISGLQMQTLFKNPLAGPYILGISSGAGLGVAFVILGAQWFSIPSEIMQQSNLIILAAIAGSLAVLMFIFWASLRVKDIMTVLILGVMIAAIINAVISILQYYSADAALKSFVVWTFGSLDAVSMKQVGLLLPLILLNFIIVFFFGKPMNLMLLGDNYAKSMGVNVKSIRLFIILTTGIMAGAVTAFCGPIGFIGIVVPHICRLVFKTSDHRILIPASALMGAVFMLFSDLVAHLPGASGILPINSVTAILGIPFIIWMVFGNKVISKSF